jgi:RND family efflux transporter MFP subunit
VQVLKMIVLVGLVVGAIYWFRFSPVAVTEHRVQVGPIVAEVMGTGTLEARLKSTISPKIAGRIEQILVDQGDRIKAGQLLFSLDDAELQQQVEIAQAALSSSQAALRRLEADQVQAAAVLEQAEKNHLRRKRLQAQQAVSTEDYDKATEALDIAKAGTARAEAALLEGQKQLVAAEKTLAYHEARRADTRILAPFDGLIVKRHRDPGDIVVPGSPTLALIATDEIWITAWVDETEMARLRVGQPARVIFRSEPDRHYQGQVARLGREADRETREFVVDVRLLKLPQNWAVGQRAEVYVETERKTSAVLVPAMAIQWRNDTPGIYCKENDRARWRVLKLGIQSGDMVEVAQGLQPDDIVVVARDSKKTSLDDRRVSAS